MPPAKAASKAPVTKRRTANKDTSADLPAEPGVTKRTLQNRKAQREFRKRREARVKHLEERCRRFDEIGVEANMELQRAARRLKDENEALKDVLTRLGYEKMIASIVESLDGEDYSDANLYARAGLEAPKKYVNSDSEGEEDDEQNTDDEDEEVDAAPPLNANLNLNVGLSGISVDAEPFTTGSKRPRSGESSRTVDDEQNDSKRQRNEMSSPEEDVKPNITAISTGSLAARRAARNGAAEAIGRWDEPTRTRPTDEQQSARSSGPSSPESNALLSLSDRIRNSNGAQQHQASGLGLSHQDQSHVSDFSQQQQQQQSSNGRQQHDNASPAVSYVTNNGAGFRQMAMPSPSSVSNAFGALTSGTSGSGSYGMAFMHPTQQDGALLNPNPIPFAFNLSATSQASPPDRSWWDTMGGAMLTPGQDPNDLDEKAGAVAQAMADSRTPAARQGEFEFSGLYGFSASDGQWNITDESAQQRRDGAAAVPDSKLSVPMRASQSMQRNLSTASQQSNKNSQPLSRAEHAQIFLRLIEMKVAQSNRGEKQPYTSLGFQPPWASSRSQLGSHSGTRTMDGNTPGSANMASWIDFGASPSEASEGSSGSGSSRSPSVRSNSSSSSLSPKSIYTRLSQHPAFLSTSAQELEELVEHLHPRSGRGSGDAGRSSSDSSSSSSGMPTPVQRAMLQAQRAMQVAHHPQDQQGNERRPSWSRSKDGAASKEHGHEELEVDEHALGHLMTLLDRKNPTGAAVQVTFGQTAEVGGGLRDHTQHIMQHYR